MISLSLRSVPSGATVFLSGERQGTTPLTLRVPSSTTPLALRLEHPRARPLSVSLPAERDLTRTLRLPGRQRPSRGSGDDGTFTNPFAN